MAKAELEKLIIEGVKALVKEHDEHDENQRTWVNRQIASGTSKEVFNEMFYFNGYIYISELLGVISSAMFGHPAEEHIQYERRFNGVPRGINYRSCLTDDEKKKVAKVVEGMVKANIIKISKTGAMAKVL